VVSVDPAILAELPTWDPRTWADPTLHNRRIFPLLRWLPLLEVRSQSTILPILAATPALADLHSLSFQFRPVRRALRFP
jgi:hypothetical protein